MACSEVRVSKKPANIQAVSFVNKPVRILLDGVVDEKMMKSSRALFEQVRRSEQPLVIVEINSYGGSVDCGLLIAMHMDACKQAGIIVCTYVPVHAESMGAYLFSCGTHGFRFIGTGAKVMVHEARFTSSRTGQVIKAADHTQSAESLAHSSRQLLAQMSQNCNQEDGFF